MSPSSRLAPPTASSSRSISRSRSRDSTRSSMLPVTLTPEGRGTPDSASIQAPMPPEVDVLPAFLRQSRLEVHNKWDDLEWQQRSRFANIKHEPQWARPQGDDVRDRNRYANVDPYTNNRICLRVPEGHSDYINASPIIVKNTKTGTAKNFIATQGPKELSIPHFWRMVWDETSDPAVVIMLTQTHEGGREKCARYYPDTMEDPVMVIPPDQFDDEIVGTVTLLSLHDDQETHSTIRELELEVESTEEKKKVWHMLFEGWPDFSAPEGDDRAALLKLVTTSGSKNTGSAPVLPTPEDEASSEPQETPIIKEGDNPRIVHCSAGVGRSGTFIALDWLLTELREGSLDDLPDEADPIQDVVEMLRTQRMMMVQAEPQFWFLYNVMREQWIQRWHERTGQSPPVIIPGDLGPPSDILSDEPSEMASEVSMETAPEEPTMNPEHLSVDPESEDELVNSDPIKSEEDKDDDDESDTDSEEHDAFRKELEAEIEQNVAQAALD